MSGYARPAVLVSTAWVSDHLSDPKVRLIEVDVDTSSYVVCPTYLLGYPKVRNYDGSWTEWGSLIGAPIER